MKRTLFTLLLTALCAAASAYDFEVGGIYYDITSTTDLTVSVTFKDKSYASYSGSVTVPSTVTYDSQTYTVTAIGKAAFYYNEDLTAVSLPATLTSIEGWAFSCCFSLASPITIPGGVTTIGQQAFSGCDSMTTLILSEGVQTIESGAFVSCPLLQAVTIPSTVTSLANDAFQYCSAITTLNWYSALSPALIAKYCKASLTTITLGGNLTTIPDQAFQSYTSLASVTLSSGLTTIGQNAFFGCTSLTSITVPSTVTSIGAAALCNCTSLTSVTLPSGITVIPERLLYRCSSLTSYTIPSTVTTIGNMAFRETGLTSVVIPEGVTTIGNEAFYDCTSLTSLSFPSTVTEMDQAAFGHCYNITSITWNNTAFFPTNYLFSARTSVATVVVGNDVTSLPDMFLLNYTALTSVTLPTTLTAIGNNAFQGCSSLQTIDIPSSVTTVGVAAFLGCTSLTSITLPEGVTTLEESLFSGCTSLTSIDIPATVTLIDSRAFEGCTSLTSIVIPSNVSSVSAYAFNNCSSLTTITCEGTKAPVISGLVGMPATGTLYVPWGSTGYDAWLYALGSGWTLGKTGTHLIGDVNEDGNVDVSDVTFLVSMILGSTPASSVGDISGDGNIDVSDVTQLVSIILSGSAQTQVMVSALTLDHTSLTLAADGRSYIYYTVTPSNATYQTVTWSSSDESVATVSAEGMVYAHKPGTATITAATADGSGVTATCAVTVTACEPVAVDLGLPSGRLWCSINVGAYSPANHGDYFAWGETEGYLSGNEYSSIEYYKWLYGGEYMGRYTQYSETAYQGIVDNLTTLLPEDDAATAFFGSDWCTPTTDDWEELINTCNWTWQTREGVSGYCVSSCSSDNNIFIPVGGYRYEDSSYSTSVACYWTADKDTESDFNAYSCYMNSSTKSFMLGNRALQMGVRPVRAVHATSITLAESTLTTASGTSQTLTATILPAGSVEQHISWTSSNPSVGYAKDGVFYAIAAGTTTVTATLADNPSLSATLTVTVTGAGHKAVDLGLPSGTLWATANMGALSSTDFGDYFAWGETTGYLSGKTDFTWSNYKWGGADDETVTKYCADEAYGTVDDILVLQPEDDAAHVQWGDDWRMPTYEEWTELFYYCHLDLVTVDGVKGLMITNDYNSNILFLPCAGAIDNYLFNLNEYGYYWSSTVYSYPSRAYFAYFSTSVGRSSGLRSDGNAIRPVRSGTPVALTSVSLNQTTLTFSVGEVGTLQTSYTPANAYNHSFVWTTSDASVVAVNEWGSLTAVGAGTAVITATNEATGLSASCTVTVNEDLPDPEYVDLALPSGTKWATFNVGASAPERGGDFFAWGETVGIASGKTQFDWSDYKWCAGEGTLLTRYNPIANYGNEGYTDTYNTLLPEDDAASANWGGEWRTPTRAEWSELLTNCEWEWTTLAGVSGYLVTSPYNGQSIFLPLTGTPGDSNSDYCAYWTTNLVPNDPRGAFLFDMAQEQCSVNYYTYRCNANAVRPVISGTPVPVETIAFPETEYRVYLYRSLRLLLDYTPANAYSRDVTWTSSDPTIASVEDGIITTHAIGSVTITAVSKASSSITATCTVTVMPEIVEAVDLGLPSGTLWSAMNVGAASPFECGDYIAWGEITGYNSGKTNFSWGNYKWCEGSIETLTKYTDNASYALDGQVDGKTALEPEDDAATVRLGEGWRTPTCEEWDELLANCEAEWTTYEGAAGYLLTSKINDENLFLPAAGSRTSYFADIDNRCIYWTSDLYPNIPYASLITYFNSASLSFTGYPRYIGLPVRPVYGGNAAASGVRSREARDKSGELRTESNELRAEGDELLLLPNRTPKFPLIDEAPMQPAPKKELPAVTPTSDPRILYVEPASK